MQSPQVVLHHFARHTTVCPTSPAYRRTAALPLDEEYVLYFSPAAQVCSFYSIYYRTWDMSSGGRLQL